MQDGQEKPRFYEFADFRVDTAKRVLSRDRRAIQVTPKVFEMLVILLERRSQVVEKKVLMELLWPESFVEESNLTQNVAVLRKTLGDNSKNPEYILTVPGHGYRFVGDVKEFISEGGDYASTTAAEGETVPTRKRRLWPSVAAMVVLLLAGFVFWFVFWKAPVALEVGRTLQVTSWSGLDFYPAISPDGNTIAYSSDRNGTFEIYVKQLLLSARDVQLTSDGGQNFQPKFSPDGSMIAYHSKTRGGVWVIPATGGTAKQISAFGSAPAWSPDGSQIAFQSDPLNDLGSGVRNAMPPSTIWAVPARGGDARQLTKPGSPLGGHGAPSWSPDGKTLVFDTNDWNSSQLATVSVETGDVQPLDTSNHFAGDPLYTPDGRSVIFVADTGLSVQALPLSNSSVGAGPVVKLFDVSGNRVRQLSMDAKGKKLVYTSLAGSSNIWSADIGVAGRKDPVPLTRNSTTRTSLPMFSPDGEKIVYQSFTIGAIAHLWTMNSDGTDQKQLSSRPGFSSSWSPDGSKIYFVSPEENRTAVWYVSADAAVERKIQDLGEEIYTVHVSPDGAVAVLGSKRSGVMNLWIQPLDGGEARQITFDPEFAGFPRWSPDGKWIGFQMKRGDNTFVSVMPATGGEATQLNSDVGQSWIYDWSADSDKIIFAGQRNGIWNIYSVSRTNREQQQLTTFAKLNSFVRYPTWSPRNDRVAFEYAETTGNIWIAELK